MTEQCDSGTRASKFDSVLAHEQTVRLPNDPAWDTLATATLRRKTDELAAA